MIFYFIFLGATTVFAAGVYYYTPTVGSLAGGGTPTISPLNTLACSPNTITTLNSSAGFLPAKWTLTRVADGATSIFVYNKSTGLWVLAGVPFNTNSVGSFSWTAGCPATNGYWNSSVIYDPYFTITAGVGGTVNLTSGYYPYNSGLNIIATPNTGYRWSSWTGGCSSARQSLCSTQATYPFTTAAVFTINTYTVTFNGNGATGGSTGTQTLTYNTTTALTANGYTRSGYTFTGWSTSAGGGVNYANGANYTIGAGNVTLYAVWTNTPPPISTPTYPTNGVTVNNGGSITFTTNTVTDVDPTTTVQYYFRVATAADGENGAVCNSGWQTSTSYSCNPGVGTFYWHVYTYDGVNQTNPNYTWSFYNNAQPYGVSVSPTTGTFKGGPQTFTTVYRDLNGATNINYVHLIINYGVDGNSTAFYGYYVRSTNSCNLFGSDGNGTWNVAPYSLPFVTLTSCSASVSGTDLTVNWNLSFTNWVEANMNEYLWIVDTSGYSWGWSSSFGTISVDTTATYILLVMVLPLQLLLYRLLKIMQQPFLHLPLH